MSHSSLAYGVSIRGTIRTYNLGQFNFLYPVGHFGDAPVITRFTLPLTQIIVFLTTVLTGVEAVAVAT